MKNHWKRGLTALWVLVVCWAATEFLLSCCTGPQVSRFMLRYPNFDKVCHLVAFGAGGVAVTCALRATWRLPVLWTALISILVVSFYGATDEWHQIYTPGRTCDFFDWLADTAGAILGTFAVFAALYARDFATRSRSTDLGFAPGN